MRRTSLFALALCGGGALALAQPAWSESPSQADIAGALYPIPKAYQETRGLPSTGSMSRTTRPESNVQHIGLGPQTRRPANTRPAPVPSLAVLPGCPRQVETTDKPNVSLQVTFDFGSATLRPESIETLRKLGKALNEELKEQKLFLIEGHTDAVGSFEQNEDLSRTRAEAVRDFLVRDIGVARERLGVVGKGYCEPADPQQPYGAKNRRVVVVNQS